MKIIIFDHDKMVRAGQLINDITVTGTSNFRALAELADILDSGQPGDYKENSSKEDDKHAVEHKEV